MQDQDERKAADDEIERVRRHVEAVRERIRALDQAIIKTDVTHTLAAYNR